MLPILFFACSDYAFEGDKAQADTDTGNGSGRDTDTGSADLVETCNGYDDNGDGVVDEGFGDADADGTADCIDIEECDGVDNNGDGSVDEGFDANGDGIVDCFEGDDEAYCTPFDDFSGWNYTGEGDWHIEDGMLTEGRNGGYEGIAYIADLGIASEFLIQTSVAWTNNDNDLTGIAWAVNSATTFIVFWDDPQGDYERHDPVGEMSIARCDSGNCTTLAIDSYGSLYWPPDKTFAVWSVAVSGQDVAVILNGAVVMTASLPDVANTGPGVAGVYSNDNDGGIWWDEFCVWKSE